MFASPRGRGMTLLYALTGRGWTMNTALGEGGARNCLYCRSAAKPSTTCSMCATCGGQGGSRTGLSVSRAVSLHVRACVCGASSRSARRMHACAGWHRLQLLGFYTAHAADTAVTAQIHQTRAAVSANTTHGQQDLTCSADSPCSRSAATTCSVLAPTAYSSQGL